MAPSAALNVPAGHNVAVLLPAVPTKEPGPAEVQVAALPVL
jgi:hypothetical protein